MSLIISPAGFTVSAPPDVLADLGALPVIDPAVAGNYVVQTAEGKLVNTSLTPGSLTVTTQVVDYIATASDDVIKFTANATLTLPIATGSGKKFLVRAVGATVIIDGNGADTINGELTQTLFDGDSVQIIDEAAGLWGVY